MSDLPQMKRPWSVVGAGFNDEGVYFTFDDNVIGSRDLNLMQAAPELLEALQNLIAAYQPVASADNPAVNEAIRVVNKALGQ